MLIDEVDRADPEFEAFLLEVLAEGQVTIPELGTVRAKTTPLFVLTSNRTREMTDALRRRLPARLRGPPPPPSREKGHHRASLMPGVGTQLAGQLAAFAQTRSRAMDLRKPRCGIAGNLDWARALLLLGARAPSTGSWHARYPTAILKHEDDRTKVEGKLATLV